MRKNSGLATALRDAFEVLIADHAYRGQSSAYWSGELGAITALAINSAAS